MSEKAVYIDTRYLDLAEQAPLPPELNNRRAKVNHLIRLGLMRLGMIPPEENNGRSVPENVGLPAVGGTRPATSV